MSYLSALRLHFSGQFQANVSTVNNDPYHFFNAAFQPDYQKMEGPHMRPPNGWFNPQGDAAFRLLGCTVTSAHLASTAVDASDPVLTCAVADSDSAAPAKLVDLDPEQQLVSQIWGLTVRIADAEGTTLMRGDFEPSAFTDIWDRGLESGGGDTNAGACWQSVLTDLEWGDISHSPFLSELKASADQTGMLSIKFNTDGIDMDYRSPDFMCGRLVGTIGPQGRDEPHHLLLGRQFMSEPTNPPSGNFFTPRGLVNFCAGRVDDQSECLILDLGNALPTTVAGGPLADIGDLVLGYLPTEPSGAGPVPIGVVPATTYAQTDWYSATAGVVSIPLTVDDRDRIVDHALVLYSAEKAYIAESPGGTYLRADSFVVRCSPGETVDVAVHAMRFGQPLPDTEIGFAVDNGQLQPGADTWPFAGPSPGVGEPLSAIPIPTSAATSADGVAHLQFTAGDPGDIRWFNAQQDYGIDGQVYGVRPAFTEPTLAAGPVNPWDFISFLIWSDWSPKYNPPAWSDVQPIFQQYANLYPVMQRFLDLSGYESVKDNAWLLQLAFGLPSTDPNHMPVTRDLSPAKRAAIMAFLADPHKGDEIPPARTQPTSSVGSAPDAQEAAAPPRFARGGKAAAAARRLVLKQ